MFDRALKKLIGRRTESRNPVPSETIGVRYRSEIIDTIIHPDGRREVLNQGHNVMMNSFLPLLTDLLANGDGKQLKYWAIGSGEDSWDLDARAEVVTLKISNECTTTGNVTLTLGGTPYAISLNSSSHNTIDRVVTQIVTAMTDYSISSSWDMVRIDTDTIKFTYKTEGDVVGNHSYSESGTGATGSISVIDGQSAGDRPTPLPTQTGLVNEVYRKQIQSSAAYPDDGFHFLDGNNEPSDTPTNVLEIKLTFTASEGLKTEGGHFVDTKWREFAIVGGSGATTTLGSGYCMNIKNHACITKTVDENNQGNMIVERKIRFTFTNADTQSSND